MVAEYLKMHFTTPSITEGSCYIYGQRLKTTVDMARHGKSMDVWIATAINIKPAICINTMQKKQ